LATLPTHLERGPILAGQSQLWVKRDDLTGLGMGGNKADCLITVGAGQSNHCRMTAAAGAMLGLEVHLVLAGDRPKVLEGNQLLSERFGAHQHFTGAGPSEWGLLEIAREDLTEELSAQGLKPYSIPIGGSTAVGALGYIVAYQEIVEQAVALNLSPKTIVFTSSSGGTHAGLVAGRAHMRAIGRTEVLPNLLAIGVAKGVVAGFPSVKDLAQESLAIAGLSGEVLNEDVEVDARWLGEDYAIPTDDSRAAITWAAHNGAWVLDDVYTAKGMAGLIGNAAQGRWASGDDVIFIHTGGSPEVFVRHD
jgi:1-aminocyclopropane-1-carboxylate deaminase/D-cysteine desulfhydrase-like pyridoxal-dependent ACC family enzyme